MARPLIATKLYVPEPRRGLVSRPRLIAPLRRGAETKLTLLSAPAGFGKTTLLADWLASAPDADRLVAWVSLDRADTDPSSFWTYVVSSLQGAVPGFGTSCLELIIAPTSTEVGLTRLLNELASVPGDLWLILDDYHLVDQGEVRRGVAFLLDHLPPNAHLVLSTRADPDLPLARWRARGDLVEIRAADLRFDPEEAARYLEQATGRRLPADDVAALEERTEGWIAALQLAALSLRGRDDVSGFIARFAGNDRYIVDYLVEEVLHDQPPPVRDFLLSTAVLDRLTGPLCEAVSGLEDGTRMLLTLDRANLFVVALDDQREWYRYHHLFADVLRARVLAEQPELVPLLHRRASRWYEDHDLPDEAIRHALAARDVDRAARLMELAVSTIRRHRQEATMYGWLKALPRDAVRRSPVLSLFYGSMLMASGDLGAVEPWLDDAEQLLGTVPEGSTAPWADTEDLRTLPSTVAVYRAALAQARGDTTATAEHARRALRLAGPEDHLARGGAAGFLGFAAWARGDVPNALTTFSEAVTSLHAAGSVVDALSGTVVLADLWLAAGRPGTARRLCAEALERGRAHGDRAMRATAELHVALSEIEVEIGALKRAEQHLQTAAALSDQAPMTESRFRWFVAMALLARANGDLEEAIRHLNQAEQLHRPGFFPNVRPIAAIKARIQISQGRLSEAADWARDRRISVTEQPRYLAEFEHLTLVRLVLAQHRTNHDSGSLVQVADLLDRLAKAAETSGRAGSLLEIRLLQALTHDARGRRQDALASLTGGFDQAPELDGYARLFLDEGGPMIALLREVGRKRLRDQHLRRLLDLDGAAEPSDADRLPPTSLASPLTERELQVLRLLDSDLSAPQIGRELFVSHNTVRTHTKHIFAKLGVTGRRAAVRRARERGLI